MRDAVEFKGKDLLLIGTSYSAEDIASQCWKYGAKSITISHRTKPIGYKTWPENITEVPLLQKVVSAVNPEDGQLEQGGTAYFADGTSKHVDAIMLCTGYIHHFPFLSGSCPCTLASQRTHNLQHSLTLQQRSPLLFVSLPGKLLLNPHDNPDQPKNKIWLQGLYRGIFWIPNPKLIHIGPHTGFFTMNLFDSQALHPNANNPRCVMAKLESEPPGRLGCVEMPSWADTSCPHGRRWRRMTR